MSKPIVAVRLEGTLSTNYDTALLDPGTPITNATTKLQALHGAYYVIIVSPIANTFLGLRIVIDWLRANGMDAYDEVWEGVGFPSADMVIDAEAQEL